jgi:uncharacterized membrane protein YadS
LLSGSRREIPIFAVGFIVLALISAGYFDEAPALIFAFIGGLLLTYYFLNPRRSMRSPG